MRAAMRQISWPANSRCLTGKSRRRIYLYFLPTNCCNFNNFFIFNILLNFFSLRRMTNTTRCDKRIHLRTHARTYTCMWTYINTYMHTYIHTYINTICTHSTDPAALRVAAASAAFARAWTFLLVYLYIPHNYGQNVCVCLCACICCGNMLLTSFMGVHSTNGRQPATSATLALRLLNSFIKRFSLCCTHTRTHTYLLLYLRVAVNAKYVTFY